MCLSQVRSIEPSLDFFLFYIYMFRSLMRHPFSLSLYTFLSRGLCWKPISRLGLFGRAVVSFTHFHSQFYTIPFVTNAELRSAFEILMLCVIFLFNYFTFATAYIDYFLAYYTLAHFCTFSYWYQKRRQKYLPH